MAARAPGGGEDAVAMADDMARLKALSDVSIDEVATPEAGVLTPEEAWTISAAPARVRIGDGAAATPVEASSLSPFPTKPVPQVAAAPANVDTTGIERLVSTRLDGIEDSMTAMEMRLMEMLPQLIGTSPEDESAEADADADEGEADSQVDMPSGDRVITADGQVLSADGAMSVTHDEMVSQKRAESLMELYEAQALALNPFLANPSGIADELQELNAIGPHMLAALMLDNLSGMGASSFARKAVNSSLLSDAEGKVLLSIVELAHPGDPDSALDDVLPDRALLTFTTLLDSWRSGRTEG